MSLARFAVFPCFPDVSSQHHCSGCVPESKRRSAAEASLPGVLLCRCFPDASSQDLFPERARSRNWNREEGVGAGNRSGFQPTPAPILQEGMPCRSSSSSALLLPLPRPPTPGRARPHPSHEPPPSEPVDTWLDIFTGLHSGSQKGCVRYCGVWIGSDRPVP